MELFLIRHAIAVDREPTLPDAERPLTPKGRRRFQRAVDGLRRLEVRIDRLYTSPMVRAVETARLLADLVEDVRVTQSLARSPDPSLLDELQGERVALVGHEPWLSELCCWLLTGETDAAEALQLKKGGMAWLQGPLEPGKLKLKAVLTPRVLRLLGQ